MRKLNLAIKLIVLLTLVPSFIFCNSAGQNTENEWAVMLFVAVVSVVILAAILALSRMSMALYELQKIRLGIDVSDRDQKSSWEKLKQWLTDIVPVEKEKQILLHHDYDGIQELDNNLPPWWLYGFYLSVIYGIVYFGYYHYYEYGLDSREEYKMEMAEAQIAVDYYLENQANTIDVENLVALVDQESISRGLAVFRNNCIACHLEGGGGSPVSVGPNLTDEYWLHGGDIKDIFKTVKFGVIEKGMIAWKDQLKPVDIHRVSSYILSLQGTNPPNAKEPQGELYSDSSPNK